MAVVVEFQDDINVWNMSDQYLSGNSLMVTPIFNEYNRRKIYFPKCTWTDWWTGERIKGNCWIDVDVSLEKLSLIYEKVQLYLWGLL